VIVVDASVLATALVDDTAEGGRVRSRLRGTELAAPEIIDLEVLSVLRRLRSAGNVTEIRAGQAVADLKAFPIDRAPHRPLVARCWELRANLSPYDAAYVALAEALGTTLVTADARLAHAPGPRCDFDLLG
jgi:predicted nucleic acid-binding protein